MPIAEGIQRGLHLWINLSSKDKMMEPRYQEIQCEDIKRAEKDDAQVRIIAGESMGVRLPVYIRIPTMYLDFTLNPGSQLHQSIPESWNACIYVIEGEGIFCSLSATPTTAHHTLVLGLGDGVSLWNKSSNPLKFVLIGGEPLNEPVVQYGSFVMNTQAEIKQTMDDYRFCKNRFEKAKYLKSQAHG